MLHFGYYNFSFYTSFKSLLNKSITLTPNETCKGLKHFSIPMNASSWSSVQK